jgi:photosystem II stability/assembly factor-like uncharacterized protein
MIVALLALALATSMAVADAPQSAPYAWRNVKVGGGGYIPGIVFSRVEKGLAYLRSDMGGCYRWDDRAKRWIPLQDAMSESSYFGVESIAPDPIDASVVYIAAGMYRSEQAAILHSRDRGATWDAFAVPFRMGGNEDGRGLGERLAIDPNDNRVLLFGSRNDGLWRSADRGQTWSKVESFPMRGRGLPQRGPANGGVSFVVFDRAGKTIVVGCANPGDRHLFRSDDAGATWRAIDGGPKPELLPVKAEIDDPGVLYVAYANHIGPNDITDGAVWKLDTRSNAWTDITPDRRPDRPRGGYMGLSLDRQNPGTLAVATIDRWSVGDTVWRSTDGGATWSDLREPSRRDVSATPFLLWGKSEARLGWWMSALAIDPFDADHAAYATGATIYATNRFSDVSDPKAPPTLWRPWVEGIEQTAIITLLSPPQGAPLVSGFGDIGGFVHDDLDASPPRGMFDHPMFDTTTALDCADPKPNVIVRSGRPNERQAPLAYSEDGGRSWQPMQLPKLPDAEGERRRATPAIVVSADGGTFVVMTRPPMFTRDRGTSWKQVAGPPRACRPVPDRVDAAAFYALDFATAHVYASSDGGATFARVESTGLPSNITADEPTWHETPWPLHATRGRRGDLWFVSRSGLFHSRDGGKTFERAPDGRKVQMLSFGKPPRGSDDPALFAVGTMKGLKAIWRSDDAATSWVRVNDDQHQFGTRFRCLAGDPRVFGRIYVGTDGRGILVGEPRVDDAAKRD